MLITLLFNIAPLQAAPKSKPTKAASKAITPKPGSKERRAIMDALRVPVQKETKFPVIFRVGHLKTQNGWAFYSGNALHKNGKAIDEKFLWGEMAALLRKQGKTWKVLHWGFATDVSVVDESKKKYLRAPRGIFPY
ncbi:MAG TPA: hypothetical protein VGB77_13100 [Abditibacteriaceae bacterium]